MPLERVLEPEVMDSPEDAVDYDTMDHSAVNQAFVDALLAAVADRFKVQSSKFKVSDDSVSTLNLEPGTLNSNDPELSLDVLDVGTGTALIPVELCGRFQRCRVMAADAAASMLDLARYHVEANSLTERIQLALVDAKALPFEDAMFDVVMSNSIVHHIPEPLEVLREAVRVARPGGLLFFRDLMRPDSQCELDQLVATYAAEASDHQRQLFSDSLHAALSLAEIQSLVSQLDYEPTTVQQTSDRHWTWTAARASAAVGMA